MVTGWGDEALDAFTWEQGVFKGVEVLHNWLRIWYSFKGELHVVFKEQYM